MKTFVELFRESVIMRGVLAVIVVGGATYMVVSQQPVPDWYIGVAGAIVGYFFGSGPAVAISRAAEIASLKKTINGSKEVG